MIHIARIYIQRHDTGEIRWADLTWDRYVIVRAHDSGGRHCQNQKLQALMFFPKHGVLGLTRRLPGPRLSNYVPARLAQLQTPVVLTGVAAGLHSSRNYQQSGCYKLDMHHRLMSQHPFSEVLTKDPVSTPLKDWLLGQVPIRTHKPHHLLSQEHLQPGNSKV
jgi:hypothetical protein